MDMAAHLNTRVRFNGMGVKIQWLQRKRERTDRILLRELAMRTRSKNRNMLRWAFMRAQTISIMMMIFLFRPNFHTSVKYTYHLCQARRNGRSLSEVRRERASERPNKR